MTTLEPSLHLTACPDANGGHCMAYWQWGDPQAGHVVVCAHGLSRQGRDFDVLARSLCARAGKAGHPLRVVCPDVVGRGRSDWLKDPIGYQIPNYAADMLTMLAQLKPVTLDWVGTSMGGLIGMVVCAQLGLAAANPAPTGADGAGSGVTVPALVRKLVLNDVGPTLQWEAIQRIGLYVGNAPRFASLEKAAQAMWIISTGFGPHTPAEWLELSRPMVKPVDDAQGGVALHYDPAIAVPIRALTHEAVALGEAGLWALYDAITAQTLLARGALSDLLSPETAQAMTQRGPKARLVEFEGVGHAPTLIAQEQVNTVTGFLLG